MQVTHLVLATEEVQKLLLYGPSSDASDAKPAFTTTNNTSTTVAGNGETANGTGKGTIGAATSRKGKTPLRTMLVDLLTFFANTYRDVFGIEAGPPLHDPLAVAAVLGNDEIEFYDYDPRPLSWPMSPSQPQQQLSNGASKRSPEAGPATAPHRPCERFTVHVVTDGTHAEALAGMAQTGRTVATLLPPGQPGVRIPRGLDIDAFWRQLEMCVARADAANEAAGLVLDARY